MSTAYLPGGLPPPYGAAVPVHPMMLPFGAPRMVVLKKPQLHPTVVVLTQVPSFLSHSRNLRDWLYSVGSNARSISYSRDNRAAGYHNQSTTLYLKHKSSSNETVATATSRNNTVAVIRMSHSTGAYHVCRFWEQAKRRMLQDAAGGEDTQHVPEMNAYLLVTTSTDQYLPVDPLNKDLDKEFLDSFVLPSMYGNTLVSAASFIPQPPPPTTTTSSSTDTCMDVPIPPSPQEVEESLVLKLIEAYTSIRFKQQTMDALAPSTFTTITGNIDDLNPISSIHPDPNDLDFKETEDVNNTTTNSSSSKLNVQKVAAAAGGGMYDEDTDPLNAPIVLEAVTLFKRALEERDVTVKKKRNEYVDLKIREYLISARTRLTAKCLKEKEEEEGKKQRVQEVLEEGRLRTMALAAGLPLPPPPMMRMPLPAVAATVVVPPSLSSTDGSTVLDTGKRGISNLPSWMTTTTTTARGGGGGSSNSMTTTSVEEEEGKKRKMYNVQDDHEDSIQSRKPRMEMEGTLLSSMTQIRADNQAADAAAIMKTMDIENITNSDILNPTCLFPPLSHEVVPLVQNFVTLQIIKYLGEEEPTMIDFVMSHVQKPQFNKRTTGVLLDELSLVLENDAQLFVVDLFRLLLDQWKNRLSV